MTKVPLLDVYAPPFEEEQTEEEIAAETAADAKWTALLWSQIDLEALGVMEHQLHGADGRFVKHHADKKGLTLMSARVDAEGGFTFDPVVKGKGPPLKGYALSTHKGTEEVHKDWAQRPAKERRRILENYTHRHWEKLRDDGSFIGGWKDGGDFYLDISTVVQDRKKAVDLGKQNSQIAIFDLEKGESIYMENE